MSVAPGEIGRWSLGDVEVACTEERRPVGTLSGATLARRERSVLRARGPGPGDCATYCAIEGRPDQALSRSHVPREVVATFVREGRRERMRGKLNVFGREATIASEPECGGDSAVFDEG